MSINRRNFLKTGALIAVGSSSLGGIVTAAEAYKNKVQLQLLTAAQALTLNRLGEQLVSGAEQAGLVHFIDYQLSLNPNDCMLTAKYFQVKPPYIDFYSAGVNSLNRACHQQYQKPFHELDAGQSERVIDSLFKGDLEGWQGPPSPLFYLLVRSDAVDVVYGTPEGFEKLGIPYMAHIMPPENWHDD